MLNNVDYDNLCQRAGEQVMDGDHIARDIARFLNNLPTKKAAMEAACIMAAKAAEDGDYLRAFLCDCAEQELSLELEEELP